MYEVVTHAVHRVLLRWWLYIQLIKFGSTYLVGENLS